MIGKCKIYKLKPIEKFASMAKKNGKIEKKEIS
jgi:hypothetical protein